MKKVYYLCHCGSGRSVHANLLELVKEEGSKLLFHINDYDWDKNEGRTITLKATRKTQLNCKGEKNETIDFRSSKEQYKYSFIREMEIDDNEEPKKFFIEM